MQTQSRGVLRKGITGAILLAGLVGVQAVSAQESELTEAPAAPSEFMLENVEGADGEVGGFDAEQVDAAPVQAAEIEAGDTPENVSRFKRRQIEEIVVQARKRSELLEDTPVSVTALGETTLREAGITRLDQIQELVPNLQAQGGLSGQETMLQIRGVGSSRADLAFDPGVGIYVDGVFLPRAQGNFLDVLDVQQIEVLRGPQGTLFGKNTVGGAINMTTVKPTESFEGSAFLRVGNYDSVVARASLNIPIDIGWFEDRLFSRFTVGSNNRKGYIYNALYDEDWADQNSFTFLGSLRFLPTDEITIDLSGTWSTEHTKGLIGRCITQDPDAPLSSPQLVAVCPETDDPYVTYADTKGLQAIESYGTWMTVNWDLPDLWWFEGMSLRNLTSWREQIPRTVSDVDGTRIPTVGLYRSGGASWTTDGDPGFARQISTELQITGNITDRFNFIAGYFVFWEKADDRLSTLVETPIGPTNPPYPDDGIDPPYCGTDALCIGRTTRRDTHIDNWTWALFTQGTLDVTDWLAATAGLRYTEDKKGLQYEEYRYPGINPWNIPPEPARPDTPGPLETDNPQVLGGDEIFTSWTPMASLAATMPGEYIDGTLVDHLMGYFTYSKGFKGGGFNALIGANQTSLESFDPETLDNFEVGLKTIAFDQLLTLNLSAFMGKYNDIQVTSQEVVGINPDGSPQLLTVVNNAAAATTRGIEIELLSRPWEGWVVTGSLGLLDGRYEDFPDAISDFDGSAINRSGQRFQNVPAIQSFLSVQYSHPANVPGPSWLQGWVTPRIEWSHTGAINYVGPELPAGRQPARNLVNLRLSYSFMDDNAEVALWSKNVGDVEYFSWATPVVSTFGFVGQYFAIGRTFGAELSYRF